MRGIKFRTFWIPTWNFFNSRFLSLVDSEDIFLSWAIGLNVHISNFGIIVSCFIWKLNWKCWQFFTFPLTVAPILINSSHFINKIIFNWNANWKWNPCIHSSFIPMNKETNSVRHSSEWSHSIIQSNENRIVCVQNKKIRTCIKTHQNKKHLKKTKNKTVSVSQFGHRF